MQNYTRIIGSGSTNIRTPTTAEIAQGNDALEPLESDKNNGYMNEMSAQIGRISRELVSVLTAASITPDQAVDNQVLSALQSLFAATSTKSSFGVSLLSAPIKISNNSSSPNTSIDFAAGNAIFDDISGQAYNSATITKVIQSSGSFNTGNGQNGLLSGARANNATYHWFILKNPTTGAVDFGCIAGIANTIPDPTSVLPSGFTKFAFIESVLTDSSGNVRPFTHYLKKDGGSFIEFVTPLRDISASFTTSATLHALSTPLGRSVFADVCVELPDPASGAFSFNGIVTGGNQADITPTSSIRNLRGQRSTFYEATSLSKLIATNKSSQIRSRFSATGGIIEIVTNGWSS